MGKDAGYSRWKVLASTSCALVGAYYIYDLPAATNKPLESWLKVDPAEYQYALSFMYTIYSIPNIILPFICGFAMDRIGTTAIFVILLALVAIGQFCFAIGVNLKSLSIMYLGRFLLGIGAESAGVAQSRITSNWFGSKDLALALGINLSTARFGSVLNDIMSPLAATWVSVPFAAWVGFVVAVASFVGSLYVLVPQRSNSVRTEIAGADDGDASLIPLVTGEGDLTRGNTLEDLQPFLTDDVPVEGSRTFLGKILSFPLMFWQLCIILVAFYGAVLPFNTIHAAFLQVRYFPNDPQTASQVMSIPDLLSAILVPLSGAVVDYTGGRITVLVLCGASMGIVHFLLGVGLLSTPIFALIVLGVAYSFLITTWACIPLIVEEKQLATAFGLATSIMNASQALFPMMVAGVAVAVVMYRIDREGLLCRVGSKLTV
ncbi:hypothetical protein SmJEL517_g05588 [Synchytrium microbalum]|uniref:Lysosomal dipeptide transporter MFSD1 n=1 Tax=Synchytrium microbalum TaxID=1806994 RepID=A0A507BUR0_9FUNG|nr:uncharacterized protein SmJEL517_g05588 [Synchytrium microbalum]TPX30941.1 hypothetical protein SmJEL517_g05588 [Synchytrium microbalum]